MMQIKDYNLQRVIVNFYNNSNNNSHNSNNNSNELSLLSPYDKNFLSILIDKHFKPFIDVPGRNKENINIYDMTDTEIINYLKEIYPKHFEMLENSYMVDFLYSDLHKQLKSKGFPCNENINKRREYRYNSIYNIIILNNNDNNNIDSQILDNIKDKKYIEKYKIYTVNDYVEKIMTDAILKYLKPAPVFVHRPLNNIYLMTATEVGKYLISKDDNLSILHLNEYVKKIGSLLKNKFKYIRKADSSDGNRYKYAVVKKNIDETNNEENNNKEGVNDICVNQ